MEARWEDGTPPVTRCNATGLLGRTEVVTFHALDAVGAAAIALAALAALLALLAIGFLARYWNAPIFRLSQRGFVAAMCAGSLGMSFGVLEFASRLVATPLSCMAINGLLSFSLAVILASLIAKEWRAYNLFRSTQRLRRARLRSRKHVLLLAADLAITLLLLVLWFALEPPVPEPCAVLQCSSSGLAYALWAFLGAQAVAAIAMCVVSVRVSPLASDARGVLACVLLLFVNLVTDVAVVLLTNANSEQIRLTVALSWLLFTAVGLGTVVFRRARWVNHSSEEIKNLFLRDTSGAKPKQQPKQPEPEQEQVTLV